MVTIAKQIGKERLYLCQDNKGKLCFAFPYDNQVNPIRLYSVKNIEDLPKDFKNLPTKTHTIDVAVYELVSLL